MDLKFDRSGRYTLEYHCCIGRDRTWGGRSSPTVASACHPARFDGSSSARYRPR
jgi:hypothetical protein